MESVVVSRRLRVLMVTAGALFVTFGFIFAPYSTNGASGFLSGLVAQGTMILFGAALLATAFFYRDNRDQVQD